MNGIKLIHYSSHTKETQQGVLIYLRMCANIIIK